MANIEGGVTAINIGAAQRDGRIGGIAIRRVVDRMRIRIGRKDLQTMRRLTLELYLKRLIIRGSLICGDTHQ